MSLLSISEPPPPSLGAADLYRKLLLLNGLRLLIGTALLIATARLTLDAADGFVRGAEGLLYGIIASIYLASLAAALFLRAGRYLRSVAYGQIVGDLIAATGLVYLTGGAESIFTILYPLAIVNAAIGLSRRGATIAASASAVVFMVLVVLTERSVVSVPAYLSRPPLPTPRLLLTLAANLSAFVLTAALSGYL
ncbi:MAG: hypothetical protein JST92_16215, partial [Deltaproteobacteria bacterium]|nr:hypothetical protein [Deltaproteobacteria bacterium]